MSRDFTLGVEEEYQLVDPETGELRSGAAAVLAADWCGDLKQEIHLSQVEIGTEVCSSAAQVADELARLRLQAATAAAAEGFAIMAAALHPFGRWEEQYPSPGERYDRIRELFGRIVRSEHIFGMHIHVGVPEGVERAPILSRTRWFLPHLLALSASSPVYEGEDTGFASYRTVLVRRLAHSGPPPEFRSDAEYRRFLRVLAKGGALEDEFTIYWSIRLHPEYPTVEFRGTDVCPRLEDAAAIAAFTRALVASAIVGRLPVPPGTSLPVTTRDALLSANEWVVARYGLDAVLVAPERQDAREPIRDSIRRVRDAVAPEAERLGDGAALQRLERILTEGNGAQRIRDRRAAGYSAAELVGALVADTMMGTGLDRRRDGREACVIELHRRGDAIAAEPALPAGDAAGAGTGGEGKA